jgi:hypothetical protein
MDRPVLKDIVPSGDTFALSFDDCATFEEIAACNSLFEDVMNRFEAEVRFDCTIVAGAIGVALSPLPLLLLADASPRARALSSPDVRLGSGFAAAVAAEVKSLAVPAGFSVTGIEAVCILATTLTSVLPFAGSLKSFNEELFAGALFSALSVSRRFVSLLVAVMAAPTLIVWVLIGAASTPTGGSWVAACASVAALPATGICTASVDEDVVGNAIVESGEYEFVSNNPPPCFTTDGVEV